jgi:hypothetical protein
MGTPSAFRPAPKNHPLILKQILKFIRHFITILGSILFNLHVNFTINIRPEEPSQLYDRYLSQISTSHVLGRRKNKKIQKMREIGGFSVKF